VRLTVALVGALSMLAAATTTARAQDLEPRAYAASPAGAAFVVAAFVRATGSVVVDPTLPISDVEATIDGAAVATGYTFGLFGKLALATAILPYSWGEVSGRVGEDARTVTRSGLADTRLKFSVNLVGNPAMGARDFVKAPRKTIVGTSVQVTGPSGQYYGTKLINLGTNRWSFKPEVGLSVPRGRWDFDTYLGVTLFTANDDFYPGGLERSQNPVTSLQGHVSYTVRPRLWVAGDATWYEGGEAQVAGGPPGSAMNNSRLGLTVSVPLGRSQSIKVAYSSGVAVRTGTDFRAFSVGWQWLTLTKP